MSQFDAQPLRARHSSPTDSVRNRASGGGMNLNDSVYDRLLRERIIFLGQPVDDTIANQICAQLLLLSAEDSTRDINLYINSPGGSVTAGMAIFDTMELIECDVATWAMGLAASMGQFLLSAGTKGKRYALPHARILMHQGSAGIGGTASDIKIQAEQWNLTKKEMAEITAEHTGQSVDRINVDSDRDRWFTAKEALDYGFVDHIVSRANQVPGGVIPADVSPDPSETAADPTETAATTPHPTVADPTDSK
jgi:ATP-dependent Clp protease protease subunit